MRRTAAQESGFTLVEVIIVSSLFLVVLTATLSAAAGFGRLNRENQKTNVQESATRIGIDRTMRQLRNLARRIEAPTISRATDDDFIFQTAEPQKAWVRNCLETQPGGSVRLWALSTQGAVTGPMAGQCPGTGWTRRDVVSENIVNASPQFRLPLFTYGCVAGASAACPSSVDDLGDITTVRMDVAVDDNLAAAPPATRLNSLVYLRNQNRKPFPAFTDRPLAPRQSLLNASASFDPEGRTLRFLWFRAPAPSFTCEQAPPAGTLLWQGLTLAHTFGSTEGVSGTLRPIELVVCDPGDLQARITRQVAIP